MQIQTHVLRITVGLIICLTMIPALAADESSEFERQLKAAQMALNENEFEMAADRYLALRELELQESEQVDALYWEAYARYRIGEPDALRKSRQLLQQLVQKHILSEHRRDVEELAAEVQSRLARYGDAAAAKAVYEDVLEAEEAMNEAKAKELQTKAEIQMATLQALVAMDSKKAKSLLKKLLKRTDPQSAELRRHALYLLADDPDEETARILMDLIQNDPSPGVREQAVYWLSNVESEETLRFLEDLVMKSDEPAMQRQALFAISQHGGQRAARMLMQLAQDQDTDMKIRREAVYWLAENSTQEHIAFLKNLYGDIDDASLKEMIVFSVAENSDEDISTWLMTIILDENEKPEARQAALHWAAENGDLPLEDLSRLYETLRGDNRLLEPLIYFLSERDEPEALELLFRIATESDNLNVRKNAIFWIGQSDHPKAEAFLLEIIGD
jgi:HEAT repeat protein